MYTRRATEVRRIDPKESGYADKKREGFNATFQKVRSSLSSFMSKITQYFSGS